MPEKCSALIDQIIECRKKRNMTQQELANVASLTQSVIARMENKKTIPQIDTLCRILDAMGYSLQIIEN